MLSISDTVGDQVSSAKLSSDVATEFNLGHKALFIFNQEKGLSYNQICALDEWIYEETKVNTSLISIGSPFRIRTPSLKKKSLWFYKIFQIPCLSTDKKVKSELENLSRNPLGRFYTNSHDLSFQIESEKINQNKYPANKFGNFNPLVYKDLSEKLKTFSKDHHMDMYAVGDMSFLYYVTEGIKWYNKLNIIFLIIILVAFRVFFGRWRGGVLLCINFIVSGIILFGSISFFGVKLDTLSNGLFLMVSVAALEDFIFLSEKRLTDSNWKGVFKDLSAPGFFTSLTTVIGFGSLCISDMPMIQKFGFWAAMGAIIEWLVSFIFMPIFISQFSYFSNWVNKEKSLYISFFANISKKVFPRKLTYLLLMIGAVSVYGVFHLNIEMDPVTYFPKDHHFSKSVDYLQKNRGWSADASLVFDELNTEKENIGLLEKIQTLKSVKEIDSHYITLGKLTGGFKQIDKDLISRSYKRTQGYKQFVSENDMIRAVLYLGSRNTKEVLEVYKKVGDICKDKCSLVGDNIILAQLSKKVPDILMKSFLISVVLVLLVILSLAYFKKSKNILAIVVSSLWGPLIIIGAISVFQIPLNHMSCVFIGVLIGLTGDNAIQYIWASDKSLEEGINEKAKGSIQIMLFMILASLIFQLAYFVPPRKLGMLLCFGYFSSLIGDLWILKSLITKNKD